MDIKSYQAQTLIYIYLNQKVMIQLMILKDYDGTAEAQILKFKLRNPKH